MDHFIWNYLDFLFVFVCENKNGIAKIDIAKNVFILDEIIFVGYNFSFRGPTANDRIKLEIIQKIKE